MKIARIILRVYQIVAAIVGLIIVSPQLRIYGLGFAGIAFLFSETLGKKPRIWTISRVVS